MTVQEITTRLDAAKNATAIEALKTDFIKHITTLEAVLPSLARKAKLILSANQKNKS